MPSKSCRHTLIINIDITETKNSGTLIMLMTKTVSVNDVIIMTAAVMMTMMMTI